MIFKYPYTNLYNLNLDWIIQAIKEMQSIVEPLDRVVNSVNGMTGDVEITKALLTQILGGLVETFNGRSGAVELTAEDVNATLIDITWASDPGESINDLTQAQIDEMYASGKRILIFVNNLGVADQVYFMQWYDGHAQPQAYTPTSALAGVVSINGMSGAVTLNDEDIPSTVDGLTNVEEVLENHSERIANVQSSLAYIVGDTNTTGSTLASGTFVYVKGHSTIAEGLRKVTAPISANGSITINNTVECTEGGLNALNSIRARKTTVTRYNGDGISAKGIATYTLTLSDSEKISGMFLRGLTNFVSDNQMIAMVLGEGNTSSFTGLNILLYNPGDTTLYPGNMTIGLLWI